MDKPRPETDLTNQIIELDKRLLLQTVVKLKEQAFYRILSLSFFRTALSLHQVEDIQ